MRKRNAIDYSRFPTVCLAIFITVPLMFLTTSAQAQSAYERLEIPSSFNPVGSGARALGMGGAFIAVADDATAASWNPGGLIQLETPEISIVGAYFDRTEDLDFGTNPEASGSESVSQKNVNYLSASYPFAWLNRNMIVSINYQHLYDLYRDWDLTLQHEDVDLSLEQDIDHTMEGSLSAIGIAYAIQVTPKISLGLTLNFWEDALYKNQWEAEDTNTWTGTATGIGAVNIKKIDYTRWRFSGFNYNLGLLWMINYHLTVGAVFKAPFRADLDRYEESFEFVNDMDEPSYHSDSDKNQKLDMPLSYGVGFAYRFSDQLTASLDIYRTQWDDFILTDENGDKRSAISLKSADESDVEPTTQIRLGAEYLRITEKFIIPFRGGLFYDPAPAEGSPDDYYGISLGSGFTRGQFVFDLAYQFRFGNDVAGYIYESLDFSQDVHEHMIYASIIYHF